MLPRLSRTRGRRFASSPVSMSAHLQEALVLELQDRIPAAVGGGSDRSGEGAHGLGAVADPLPSRGRGRDILPAVADYRRAHTLNPESLLFLR